MSNTWFQFKQFKINQDRCAMKVGSDSVLLGAWTEVNNIRNVADLGAGTGILGLMLAQRAKARVTAIDIDIDATIQSAENFSNSPWPELFESVCADIHELTDVYKGVFDLAIFNPPYFEGHVIAASANRTTARHLNDESNSRLHWLKTAFEITNKEGKSSMIIPFENSQKWIIAIEESGWYIENQCFVRGNQNSAIKRILLCLKKTACEESTSHLTIETSTRGEYTEAFKELTRDFYLNL